VRFVAPALDPDAARVRLLPRRRWWPRLRRPAAAGTLAGKRLPHLELVWLPFLHGSAALAGEPGRRVSCVVCASTGLASRIEPAAQTFTGPAPAAPATIERRRLERIVEEHLGRIARLAGAIVSTDPGALLTEDWAFPFWVLYWERRPGRLDFAALDAVTGERVGGAVRQALLRVLVAGPPAGA
jgi:hypothetical protein